MRHNVFVSYHHANDQQYWGNLQKLNEAYNLFIDKSVDTGEIDDSLPDETIRQNIRDEYLRDSSVTILLVGTETKRRKHIDWEIYSSMYDGKINKKSGILVITLPTIGNSYCNATHDNEKETIHPDITNWINIDSRNEYETRYPFLPPRIIDNLVTKKAYISVLQWSKIINNPSNLAFLIDATHNDREKAEYDLSRPMMRNNL